MCSIAGIISKKTNRKELLNNILKINKLLKHRGPDESNIWINKNSTVALGHNRLAIQDLSKNGSQPMLSNNKRYVLIFNGEIYNHWQLRKKLKCNWKGTSDSETLIELISKYGVEKTLSYLSGMFVFSIWDRTKEELIIVRDSHGEKPLYYGVNNNKLIFASELKVFFSG